jgi:hypothetical protein
VFFKVGGVYSFTDSFRGQGGVYYGGCCSNVQKSVPVNGQSFCQYIAISYCFDSPPRIDSILHKPRFRYGLLEDDIGLNNIPG